MYLSLFFFFKQKTAYEMRISDWSSDVCSSDLGPKTALVRPAAVPLNLFVGYLSGGPAPNIPVELRTNFRAAWSPPEDYRDWDFDGQPVKEGVVQQIGRASCRARVCQYV